MAFLATTQQHGRKFIHHFQKKAHASLSSQTQTPCQVPSPWHDGKENDNRPKERPPTPIPSWQQRNGCYKGAVPTKKTRRKRRLKGSGKGKARICQTNWLERHSRHSGGVCKDFFSLSAVGIVGCDNELVILKRVLSAIVWYTGYDERIIVHILW